MSTITETILALVAERPESTDAEWVSGQFALFYDPCVVDSYTPGVWTAMIGGSSAVWLGETTGEFTASGATAEEAIANLRKAFTA